MTYTINMIQCLSLKGITLEKNCLMFVCAISRDIINNYKTTRWINSLQFVWMVLSIL